MRLTGKVAVVTGAANGIGAATARRLASEGARRGTGRSSEDSLAETVSAIAGSGGEALALAGNVSMAADVARLVKQAHERFGRIDILINNAGINRDAMAARLTEENWDAVLDVNLKGSFLCAQAVQPIMREQNDGRIVNTASIAALGNIGQSNYAASKAGLIGTDADAGAGVEPLRHPRQLRGARRHRHSHDGPASRTRSARASSSASRSSGSPARTRSRRRTPSWSATMPRTSPGR